jgi:hypothetical protein
MKKLLLGTVALWLAFAPAAHAVNVNIDGLPAAASVVGTDLHECEQSGINNKCTATQIAAFFYGLMSGDATSSGTGALTLKNTGPGATGPIGSATVAPIVTIDAQGRVTGLTGTTITPSVSNVTGMGTNVPAWLLAPSSANLAAALTDETGTGAAVFGTAPTISSLNATTAMTLAFITGSTQCLHVNTSGVLSGTGSDCGAASGISSITPGAALVSSTTASCSQTAITTSGTLSAAECLNAQVGTTYTIVDGDRGKLITGTNAASQAYSIAQAGASTTFQSGWYARIQNKGTGPLVITPTTSTICGTATLTLYPGATEKITSDGTNYQCDGGNPPNITISSQAGANYAFVSSNFGQLVNLSNAANQIPTLPQAGTTGFPAGWYTDACNQGAGTQTITPTTSTIGGASTYVLGVGSAAAPVCVAIVSDGTNYQVVPYQTALGTNVKAALAVALSSAGGVTSTIASGTAVLGTSAIGSGACATVVTVSATNVATTDVISFGYNSDPTAVTGYGASATGAVLTIYPYPTANNVNVKVCNSSSGSITPSAMTLNWRAWR